MDKSIQRSLLNTVNQIVNKENICEECEYAHVVEQALNLFEDVFSITLTEAQEDQLIDIGLIHMLEDKKAEVVDLTEDISVIINKHEPHDVFSYIIEFVQAALPAIGAALSAGTPQTAGVVGQATVGALSRKLNKNGQRTPPFVGGRQQEPVKDVGEQPYDAWSAMVAKSKEEGPASQVYDQYVSMNENRSNTNPFPSRKRRRLGDNRDSDTRSSRNAQPNTNEDPWGQWSTLARQSQELPNLDVEFKDWVQNTLREDTISVKKKKKLFKIIFIDKGVKKKGTAVSHKGAARIVAGKKFYKVFDEHNKDITAQFKKTSSKKDDKK
jgi:hypothetical protein